ncbi:hypothetical protein EDC04DRAFT_2876124 [Pisolithus marmoratus]|nr:hypothetical protein EDC04DRAFT_2876124 [Pisolithus marmoratus]
MGTLRPNSVGNHEDNQELKLPKAASLCIILAMNVLLQSSSTFSGLVIGIPTVFGGLALVPMLTRILGGYAMSLHATVAYASAYRVHFLYLIFIGRCLNGISLTGFMYTKRYCTDLRIVGIRRRTTLASWLVIGQGFGMTLGPFSGGLLYKIGFSNPIFNGYTSPGWVMAGVYAVFWIIIAILRGLSSQTTSSLPLRVVKAPRPSRDGQGGTLFTRATVSTPTLRMTSRIPFHHVPATQCGVIFCMCWFPMLCFFILGSWEANLPVFGAVTPDLRWSPFAAGNFIALGGITAFPFLLANIFFAGHIQDRKLLSLGCGLGLSGLAVFLSLLRTGKINYGSLFVCWWAVALASLSKQLPPERNRWSSMAIQYSNYAGRVTGAVWGGSGVSVGMLNYVGLEIALVAIGAVLFTTLWTNLKTKTG